METKRQSELIIYKWHLFSWKIWLALCRFQNVPLQSRDRTHEKSGTASFRSYHLALCVIYFLKECRDIYCRKEAFQRFEGMAESVSGNWYAALGPWTFFSLSQDVKGYTEKNILFEDYGQVINTLITLSKQRKHLTLLHVMTKEMEFGFIGNVSLKWSS